VGLSVLGGPPWRSDGGVRSNSISSPIRANRVARARDASEGGDIEVIRMAMGDDQDVDRREQFKMDCPPRTRDYRALLERIEEDRIHQAGDASERDENRGVAQQGYLHK
jgi:hypothetical protein